VTTGRLDTEHDHQAHIAARRELHAIARALAYFEAVDEMGPALCAFFPDLTRRLTPRELEAIAALATSTKPLDL
jgi:hypothetical protein